MVTLPIEYEQCKGTGRIDAFKLEWNQGDRVELVLPMPPERIEAHPSTRQDCGRIALQRGPLVYCLEQADNGPGLNDILLRRNARLAVKQDKTLFGGVPVIVASGQRRSLAGWKDRLYRPASSEMRTAALRAIPYFLWANHEPGEMLVWIREG